MSQKLRTRGYRILTEISDLWSKAMKRRHRIHLPEELLESILHYNASVQVTSVLLVSIASVYSPTYIYVYLQPLLRKLLIPEGGRMGLNNLISLKWSLTLLSAR